MSHAVETRVLRTVGTLFGVAAAIYGLLDLGNVLTQLDRAPMAWTVAALVATIGLPMALGVAAPFSSAARIRVLAGAVAAGNALALVTTPLAFHGSATADAAPWTLQLTGIGTTGAALGLPLGLVVADVVLTGALVTIDRIATGSPQLGLIPVQDGAYSALFAAIFSALVVGAVRAGRSVDAASDAAIEATREARDDRVRADERSRVNGLVHDHVLTTLLVVARGAPVDPALAADAEEALHRLERLAGPDGAADAVDGSALLDRLRAQTTSIAPDAAFVVAGDRETPMPARTAEALVGATGEALRNTRRHAGPSAAVEVRAVLDGERVEITVLDDGAGFVRGDVPANRLGILTSIEARMRSVGGSAEVRSQPGRGTAVRIRWPQP